MTIESALANASKEQLRSALERIYDVAENEATYSDDDDLQVPANDIIGILEEELRLEP